MPKIARELTALSIQALTSPGSHAVGRVPGLYLQVTGTGARSWILRTMVGSRRREIGLGSYPAVTLAQAREQAQAKRATIAEGVDPVEARQAARSALIASTAAALTFKQCAVAYMAAHESGWKSAKHGQQWKNTLETYAYPVMGALMVRDVGLPQVMQVLEPIWKSKTETAVRLRNRIELVLDWAAARNYRDGLNPARWRGHLDKLLPAPSKVAKREHHPALPVQEVGAFMQRLRQAQGMGARALEFAILTAARSGEVRGATWGEINKQSKSWTIPAERMKAGKEHRVPLSAEALKLLASQEAGGPEALIFPAARGGQLSDMTLSATLRRMEVPAVPHGFRSTFRDWVSERTSYPNEMAEMALAHTIDNKSEAAYRRGDMLERRAAMMDDWAKFLATVDSSGVVVPLRKA